MRPHQALYHNARYRLPVCSAGMDRGLEPAARPNLWHLRCPPLCRAGSITLDCLPRPDPKIDIGAIRKRSLKCSFAGFRGRLVNLTAQSPRRQFALRRSKPVRTAVNAVKGPEPRPALSSHPPSGELCRPPRREQADEPPRHGSAACSPRFERSTAPSSGPGSQSPRPTG